MPANFLVLERVTAFLQQKIFEEKNYSREEEKIMPCIFFSFLTMVCFNQKININPRENSKQP